jgi:two-component system sensor kinase
LSSCISLLTTIAITRPINELVESAEIIGKGNLKHRLDIKTKNEIGELAEAFNQMTERRLGAQEALQQRTYDLGERVKELKCLYGISELLDEQDISSEEKVQRIVNLISASWQYSEVTCARIILDGQESRTENFKETDWRQASDIIVHNERRGTVEVYYLEERPESDEGVFLKEERDLIDTIGKLLGKSTEQKDAHEELEKHHDRLEKMVRERTAELDKRVSEVEQLNRSMVNMLEDLRVSNENLEITTQRLAETNKELEAFAYSVSHDLRAPLRAINGFSQMLVEDYGDKLEPEGQRQLDIIQESGRNMGQLIDDLLTFSRLGRKGITVSHIDMNVVAKEIFEQLQLAEGERSVQLKLNALPSASGDLAMIRAVFSNLLSNALKYTQPVDTAVIEIAGRTDGEEVIYSVKDNGVGFDMKYADKLFRVFQRLHGSEEFEGTGIGLALVQRIITRHGGRVWGEGKENEGATFYFSLPRS